MVWQTADCQIRAAKAGRPAARGLRRQLMSGVPHAIFPRREGLRLAPFLEVSLGPIRQKDAPRFLEAGARLVERRGRPLGMLSRMAARVEAARPAPRIFADGNADPLGDRAGLDVAIIDVPAFVGGFEISAAGEGGHAPLFCH